MNPPNYEQLRIAFGGVDMVIFSRVSYRCYSALSVRLGGCVPWGCRLRVLHAGLSTGSTRTKAVCFTSGAADP